MIVSELATRYAKSIFEIASEASTLEKTLAELRALGTAFGKDAEIMNFLSSPLVKPEQRETALEAALKNSGVSQDVHQLVLLLAQNGRFPLFPEVVEAFQDLVDETNGLVRGVVRSAASLGPAERQQIESIVEKVLNKKVIMTYKVDASVIGGLVAQAGSYTFDDSLNSHLTRLNEELKRRAL